MNELQGRILDMGDDRMLAEAEDGRRIWVSGDAVPGDVVRFRLKGKLGEVMERLEDAPERVEPACPLAVPCPGCLLQALPMSRQLELKEGKVLETLKRLGGLEPQEWRGIVASPRELGYRNKLDLNIRGRELGYLRGRELLPVKDCPLGADRLRAALPELRRWLQGLDKPRLKRVMLRCDSAADELHLLLQGRAGRNELRDLGERCQVASLSIREDVGRPWKTLLGKATLSFELMGERFEVREDGFFQVNLEAAELLLREAQAWMKEMGGERLVDLFCGCGFFSEPARSWLPDQLGLDMQVSRPGDRAWDLRKGLPEDVQPREGDLWILDPPRSGLPEKLREQLAELYLPHLLIISCNPATLARDLKAMGGYRIRRAQAFDLFPQTSHVESLVWVERNDSIFA